MASSRRLARDAEDRDVSWARWLPGLTIVVGILVAVDYVGGPLGCGGVPFRVRGRVVDARTGAPVAGVSLLTLFEPAMAGDPAELESWRRTARMFEDANGEGGRLAFSIAGSAHTGGDGAFVIVAQLSTSAKRGMSGIVWHRERSSPFKIAGALLVEREGYERLVHETTDARWVEQREGEIVGTFEVGTLRLVPR